MTSLERMRKTLLQTDGEFRRLSEEHRDLDTLIGEFSRRLFQTGNDEIEKATLKKRKLQIKDRMEVILGPSTALYGANAHSGVVNIISKSPAISEGFTMSVSGSNDERQLRKINGRWAKKLSDNFSVKLSGMYLHGYEWPYISETEYKNHLYPWKGNPYRPYDNKDNNPWKDHNATPLMATTNDGRYVMLGDGEPDHGCSNYNYLNEES